MKTSLNFFYRKKTIGHIQSEQSKLNRALSTFDLTTLGNNK